MTTSVGVAQPCGAFDHAIEHRLQVVGEPLMTLRISLVAVCCSSDAESVAC